MYRSIRSLLVSALVISAAALAWPAEIHAQRGRAHVRSSPPRVVRAYGYRPYFFGPYYSRFFWGSPWGPYGFYPGTFYGQYPRPRYGYDEATLRIQVSPKDAQVYVDGYYVGLVDSFDGTFQRLHVSPGEHLIEIYLEGHRTIRELMMFHPREGYHLKRVMEPLAVGEPPAQRPRPDPESRRAAPSYPGDRRDPESRAVPRPGTVRSEDAGALVIRVQPAGATVLIDGQKWDAPRDSDALVVHLSDGTHRVEIQKQGYRTFTTEVRVRRGETVPLNVSLRTN